MRRGRTKRRDVSVTSEGQAEYSVVYTVSKTKFRTPCALRHSSAATSSSVSDSGTVVRVVRAIIGRRGEKTGGDEMKQVRRAGQRRVCDLLPGATGEGVQIGGSNECEATKVRRKGDKRRRKRVSKVEEEIRKNEGKVVWIGSSCGNNVL